MGQKSGSLRALTENWLMPDFGMMVNFYLSGTNWLLVLLKAKRQNKNDSWGNFTSWTVFLFKDFCHSAFLDGGRAAFSCNVVEMSSSRQVFPANP